MRIVLVLLTYSSLYLSTQCLDIFGISNGYRYLTHQLNKESNSESELKVKTKWIEQPIDHFSKRDQRVWKMRLFESRDFWKKGGPVYLYIGGEDKANSIHLNRGMIKELAKETNGAMVMTEHRYYGKSWPLPYTGVESLKYLSAKQALADIEKVIRTMKESKLFEKSKFVAIGGSYPGNLAAWLKLLYPDLIDAALSSSAPVLAKKNFKEYLETVSDDYEKYGTPGCFDFIKKQFQKYVDAFQTPKGIEELKKTENICDSVDMNVAENQQYFVYVKASKFMVLAQYGTVNKIQHHCNIIMNNLNEPYDEISSYYNESMMEHVWKLEKNCNKYDFDGVINSIKNKGWYASWVYQVCNEFSYAKSTSSDKQPFSKYIPIETFYKICTLSFGKKFNEQSIDRAVDRTNALYGGLTPNVTKVVFSNGELDPWHRLGILKSLSNDTPAIFIPRSSHCKDLNINDEGDNAELVKARKDIKNLIKSWIGMGTYDFNEDRTLRYNNSRSVFFSSING